jgi:hypothetical protein
MKKNANIPEIIILPPKIKLIGKKIHMFSLKFFLLDCSNYVLKVLFFVLIINH